MSRKAIILTVVAACLGGIATVVLSTSAPSPSAGSHLSAGDPPSRAHEPSTVRRVPRSFPAAGRRRSPSLEPTAAMADLSVVGAAPYDPWEPAGEQLDAFAPEAQPHVVSVAMYLNDVLAPRLTDCVRGFRPTGWIDVAHTFYVDGQGVAHPGQVDGMSTATVELVDSDLEPDQVQRVLDCMELAALDTSFVHVPLFEQSPELGFITYQGYQFGSAQ